MNLLRIVLSIGQIGLVGFLTTLPGESLGSVPRAPQPMELAMPPAIVQLSPTEFILSRRGMILRLRQEFLENLRFVETGMTVLMEGQRVGGFRLDAVEQCRLFKDMGLHNGDIIRLVNGESAQSLWDAYLRWRGVSEATITVERRGQLISFHYQIR